VPGLFVLIEEMTGKKKKATALTEETTATT
jgi:hypothetical protein